MASTDTEKMDREAKADTPAAEDVLLGKCPRCDKNIEITGAKFQWYVRTFFFLSEFEFFLKTLFSNTVESVDKCWNTSKRKIRV